MNAGCNLALEKVSNLYLYINFLNQVGPQLCSNLIKCHVLTGTDSTRKTGTKSPVLKSDQNKYLQNLESDDCLERKFQNTEEYSIKVLQKNSASLNFDVLRYEQYKKKLPLVKLPPVSSTVNGHLQRSYYVVNTCVDLLNGKKLLNPPSYSWTETPGGLLSII